MRAAPVSRCVLRAVSCFGINFCFRRRDGASFGIMFVLSLEHMQRFVLCVQRRKCLDLTIDSHVGVLGQCLSRTRADEKVSRPARSLAFSLVVEKVS